MTDQDVFTTATAGLREVWTPRVVRLRDGDRLDLGISPVRKNLRGAELRMLAYNGSVPGPILHVEQGSQIIVHTRNDGDVETTVHWHGLRLENRYDGVPHETQLPIPIGGSYSCQVQFPDAGFYWYHPHIREDFAQEMGLYGTIIVEPTEAAYWPDVDRQLSLTLDDLLVEDGQIAPFHRSGPNFTAMGRFGNELLINGETAFTGEAMVGEVVRLYLVNTANTRIFNVAVRGARAKLIGGDSGRYERETFVEEVLLAPSERAIIDVLFDTPGEVRLEHRTPDRVYDLGAFTVSTAEGGGRAAAATFEVLRTDPELSAEHRRLAARPRAIAGQSARLLFPDAAPLRRRGDRVVLRLPDASAGDSIRARHLPAVRDEADPGNGAGRVVLRLPDASAGDSIRARHLPAVRDEAGPGSGTSRNVLRLPDASAGDSVRARHLPAVRDEAGARQRFGHAGAERSCRPRPRRWSGVGGSDAGDQPGI